MTRVQDVKEFWERNLCLEKYLGSQYLTREYFEEGYNLRYKYHYHIPREVGELASLRKGAKVLEIGVGMGIDTALLCKMGFRVTGIDLTEKSVQATKARLAFYNLPAKIRTGNAEDLEFDDESFDVVYSFGVLHHTPNTEKAIGEIHRVLKKDGIAFIMLYHRHSLNYLAHKITNTSFDGTKDDWCPEEKAYTKDEAMDMFSRFSKVEIKVDYLFGTGWGWANYLVWMPVKKILGKLIGWHLLIRVTR